MSVAVKRRLDSKINGKRFVRSASGDAGRVYKNRARGMRGETVVEVRARPILGRPRRRFPSDRRRNGSSALGTNTSTTFPNAETAPVAAPDLQFPGGHSRNRIAIVESYFSYRIN